MYRAASTCTKSKATVTKPESTLDWPFRSDRNSGIKIQTPEMFFLNNLTGRK